MAIIYIYDSTATDFTYNGQPLNKAYEAVVDNMINDSFFVTFNHPLDDKGIYKNIEKDKIVKVHTPDGMQPFRIMDRVKYMDHVSIEAWPLFYADMRNKLVKPLTIRGLSGQAAMNMFVNNLLIDTPFTFTSNITVAHDYHTQNTEERESNPNQLYNALDVFKDIVKRWQGELVINGYDVRVVNRLGKNTGALLYEKKNISDFTDEESIQDITTRLYGKSEWTERPQGSDEEVKHEISVKVESPLINAYSGIVFEKQYTNNDIRTEKEMTEWLNLKFTTENIDKPSRNIKVNTNIVDDTVINLGDSLVLKYVKHDVDMEIRMVGYTYDGYANRYITVQLGDAKQSYVGNVQNTVRDIETNVNTTVKQTVNQILNANGERIIHSDIEPVGNFKNGDIWFDNQGGMYLWDEASGMWVDHPYNKNMDVMAGEVKTAIDTAEGAKVLAISEAESALKQAKADATAKANAIKEQISGEVNTAISTAKDAKALAVSEAGNALLLAKADATAKADAVKTEVSNSVNTAIDTANTAKQTAIDNYNNAVTEAARLDGEQKVAFDTRFDTIEDSVDTFNQSVSDVDAKAGAALEKAGANDNLLNTHQNTLNTINNTTIPRILGDIKSLADGGTNLIIGSDKVYTQTNSSFLATDGINIDGLVGGEEYTFSFDIRSTTATHISSLFINSSIGGLIPNSPIGTEWTRLSAKFKWVEGSNYGGFDIRPHFYPINDYSGTHEVKNLKLEKGSIATPWTPALEDMLGKAEFQIFKGTYEQNDKNIKARLLAVDSGKEGSIVYRLNETESTADGNTQTIANIKTKPGEHITGYQTIKERSDLYERVIGSSSEAGVKSNMARAVMADSIFQTEVIDKQSLITGAASGTGMTKDPYFDKGINDLRVYDNGNTGTITIKQVKIPSDTSFPPPKGTNGYRLDIVHAPSTATSPDRGGVYNLTNGWAGGTVVVKFVAFLPTGRSFNYQNNNLGTGFTSGWLTDNKGTGKWQTYMYYYRFGAGTVSTFGFLSVTGASTGFTWHLSEYDIINVNETNASKITQLVDNIDLKVSDEKLLSRINVRAGIILIQSGTNKLNVTPETTYIENATIKSAMIDTIDVKKITGINADFTTMVTKGLTANVISSTMINANEALFDKLFSNTMATTKLAAQEAWIKNANIASLDAGKINTGEIATGRIKSGEVVAKGLVADIVKSTHIESSTGLIDKIFANEALITRLTSNSIFASKIKAIEIDASKITTGELAAARIKSKDVVTQGLTADVVKATHIKAEVGLVDKLFSTTAYIEELTNKTIFTEKIKAINISADKITAGTLDASKVSVVNLDANNITANQAKLIQAGFESSSGGTLALSGDQLLSTASDGSQVYLQNGVVGVRRPEKEGGGTIGQIGYVYDGGSPTYTIQTAWGAHFALKQRFYDTYTKTTNEKRAMYISTVDDGETTMQFYAKDFVLQGNRNLRFGYDHYINGIGTDLTLTGKSSVTLRAKERTVFVVSSNGEDNFASLYANLNMQGRTLTNTSDIRLKRDIVNDEIDSLSALMKWQHAGFNYIDPDMNQERQFSVIAQSAPDIAVAGEDGFLQVALNKQVNITSHALQQHVIETHNELSELKEQIITLKEELALLKGA